MVYPKPAPSTGQRIDESLKDAKRRIRDAKNNENYAEVDRLEKIVDKLKEDYLITSENIKNLKRTANVENKPHLLERVNELKEMRKKAFNNYKNNKHNPHPIAYFMNDYDSISEGCLTWGSAKERFSFAVLTNKRTNEIKMTPTEQVRHDMDTLKINVFKYSFDYYSIVSSRDRDARFVEKSGFNDTIVDDELVYSIKEWTELYEYDHETIGSMTPRAEIYEQLKKYTISFLDLKKISKEASTSEHFELLKVEEDFLAELRDSILESLRKNIEILKYLTIEKRDNLAIEKFERVDDSFSEKLALYRASV